ncbi:MAG: SLBB domain-containing protein [Candidatus Cloacimonetes bacterium]|nr:SLBB domain-containing protein [Candidatus Cloacimonadota bacterium]
MKTKYLCSIAFLLLLSLGFAMDFPLPEAPQLSISISGYVELPGSYKVYPTDRISDALMMAQTPQELKLGQSDISSHETGTEQQTNPIPGLREEDTKRVKTRNYPKHQALRHIRLTRGGKEEIYDLLRYYRLGDISQNPLLRDGDLIHVPVLEHIVNIWGAVYFAGDVEYKVGDTVGTMMDLALGVMPGAELSAVRLSKYQGIGSPYTVQTLNLRDEPQHREIEMHPGDWLMIPLNSRFQEKNVVSLNGGFLHQGWYVLAENATLWDAIQMAGGIIENADPENAVVLNHDYNAEPDPEFERLKLLDPSSMSPIEYAYFRNKLRQVKGKYSVDFAKVLRTEGKEGDIVLNNNDYIYLPHKLNMIRVSGQVKNPGLVPYKADEDWRYYVQQAGGYANNYSVTGIRLLRASSGNWEKTKKNQPLKPGDMIFVSDKLDRSNWVDVRDIVGILAGAVTIVLGVVNFAK